MAAILVRWTGGDLACLQIVNNKKYVSSWQINVKQKVQYSILVNYKIS